MKIHFKYINAAKIKILTNDLSVQNLLSTSFRYKDPSYSPFNRSQWDGYQRLYNKRNGDFKIGLWFKAFTLINNHFPDADVSIDPQINLYSDIPVSEISEFISSLTISVQDKESVEGHKIVTPYKHQQKALIEYAQHGRYTMLSATSSGKSMMCYLILRYARMVQDLDTFLIVVPTQSLVDQMYNNFKEYSYYDNRFDTEDMVQRIYKSQTKNINKPIIISTWQSLQNLEKSYFKEFEFLFVDECHQSDAKKLTYISNSCVNANNRIGATGSLKDTAISEMMVESLFGYSIKIINALELIELKHATPLNINLVSLYYPEEMLVEYKEFTKGHKNKYQKEVEFLTGNVERKYWLSRFIDSLEGNTLVLYDRKDTHLYDDMRVLKSFSNKTVHIISGDVKVKERNIIKKQLETEENQVLGATFGTFQLGESVNNLHNLVIASSTKSNVRILQSIGRMMRLHKNKDTAEIYDIVDVINKEQFNYVLTHAEPRLRYYVQEGHNIKLKNVYL